MFGFKKLLGVLLRIETILFAQYVLLSKIEKRLNPLANSIEFYIINNGIEKKVVSMFLKVNENLPMSIKIKDKFGNDAKVDGAPVWAVTDESLGALEVAEDGMSATFKPSGLVGALKVQVKADADMGEGVKELLGELDLELLAGEAASLEVAAGEAQPQ